MIGFAAKAAVSMITQPARHPDRGWNAELLCRTLRNAFVAASDMPFSRFRQIADAAAVPHPALTKVDIERQTISDIDCLVVNARDTPESDRVMVYFHGGGYVVGSPVGYKPFLAQLAANTGCKVVAPDYRLAPEHPFPAPQDDCLSVAKRVFTDHAEHRKILTGDSAGGALAIACALELNEEASGSKPDACVLLSPWVEPTASSGTMVDNQTHDFLTIEFLNKSLAALMENASPDNPRINFRDVELSNLPPTLLQCGEAELFFDQDQSFAQRARAQGVKLELQSFAGQFHVFQVVAPMLKASRSAMRGVTEFLNQK